MAGLGTRFQKVSNQNPEYKKPKPFINVKNWPMVRWATGSFPFFKRKDATFIILKEHNDAFGIEKILKDDIYSPEINVLIIDKVTRGPAETAYKAASFVDPEDSLLITDSDIFYDGAFLEKSIKEKDSDTVGIIPVFRARNEGIPKWSYSLTRPGTNYIEKVAEKDRVLMEAGAYANMSGYYFSKAKYFLDLAKEVIEKGETSGEAGKMEFYVAPLYQILIDRSFKVQASFIPQTHVWSLGTPSDLEYFLANYEGEKPLYE